MGCGLRFWEKARVSEIVRNNGFILIIILIFIFMLTLIIMTSFDYCLINMKLAKLQQHQLLMLEAAEGGLKKGEHFIEENWVIDNKNNLSSLATNFHCISYNSSIQMCYAIEQLLNEECTAVITHQKMTAVFFRVLSKSHDLHTVNNPVALQSTFVLLIPNATACMLKNKLTQREQIIYAGRQSWHDLIN